MKNNFDQIDHLWEELLDYFEDSAPRAILWLNQPNPLFEGRKPINLISNGEEKIILDHIILVKATFVQ